MRSIVVIDFGSQYTQLIARSIRLRGVYSEVVGEHIRAADIITLEPTGLILSGSPDSICESGPGAFDHKILALGIPVLGICYGMHLLAQILGGHVRRTGRGEYGLAAVRLTDTGTLLAAPPPSVSQTVWMSHADTVVAVPPGFRVTATTSDAPVAAMEDPAQRLFGLQFHPELSLDGLGGWLIDRFLDICAADRAWVSENIAQSAVYQIRDQVRDGRLLCALSGGIDSTVAAILAHRAVGSRLNCAFIDTGLLRLGEPEEVIRVARQYVRAPMMMLDCRQEFLRALRKVGDPEAKRKIIGAEFIRAFHRIADAAPGERYTYLLQGTIYSDVIESGPGRARKIKSHHNVGGLPADIGFDLVEPLRRLFKDEVRIIGSHLGLPDKVVLRQPFPGPGLAIRILGEITPGRIRAARAADLIVRQEIAQADVAKTLWSFFAVLVPSAPSRQHVGNLIVVRAVTSDDAMTAGWARLPHAALARISHRIMAEVPRVKHVVYDVTSKPPGTIDWE